MKKIFYYSAMICLIMATTYSCKPILDNYDAPDQTLSGKIIDITTGEPIQVESNSNVKIRIEDLTWKSKYGSVTPQDLNVTGDGTFNDSKLFSGTYKIYPYNGPFVPVYYTGVPAIDNSDTITLKGGGTVKEFTVAPFLSVSWAGGDSAVKINNDTTVTVIFRFRRGTQDPVWIKDVTDVQLYVSRTDYVGNSSYEPSMSKGITYSGTAGNAFLGLPVSITSGKLISGNGHGPRTWYLRIGARTNDVLQKQYNYTLIKSVTVIN